MKYLVLTALWIVMIVLVYPIGEFPLNDDWAYCKDVSILLHQGRLEIVNWSAMTLVSQIVLGAFWCKIFGFSFLGLRILTSLVGLLGLFVSYKLIKEITSNDKTALFCTIIIAINPLFFTLSNSFMTDVYFYTISTTAVYFFRSAILSDKIRDIVLATVFILIAILIRQIGIVIAASFAITYLYQAKSFEKSVLAKALTPLLLGVLTLYLFSIWATMYQSSLQTYVSTKTAFSILGKNTFMHIFNRIGTTGLMLSLFVSPLLVLSFPHFWANFLKKENRIALYITAICIIPLIRAWKHFPLGNVLYNFGLGPKLLKDSEMQKLNFDFSLPPLAINPIRTFCFAGALMIFYYCFSFIVNWFKEQRNRREITKENAFSIFSFLNIILLFGTFIIPDFFFDRYLVQMILPFIIVLIPYIPSLKTNLRNTYFAYGIVFLISLFSIVGTHDFFECNRARWQAIDYLLNDLKISPNEIDGGFEFNGWYETKYKDDPSNPTKSWWFVNEDNYMLSFSPMEGYEIINKIPYNIRLSLGTGYIYVSSKIKKPSTN
jgi:Dolichyl-phosphate-mannose-protein mannosyltransferase